MFRLQPAAPPTILIVEPDLAMRNALAFALEAEGYRVRPLSSAAAVDDVADLAALDCLVIDQSLGDVSGLDFLASMRAAGATQPAVILMARSAAGLIARARRLDASVIEKPLLDDQLFGMIHRLVDGRRTPTVPSGPC
ncbi:MAG: response regulator [Caulobacter sp.]|nr:response regulator [Caulobacter sp.]